MMSSLKNSAGGVGVAGYASRSREFPRTSYIFRGVF